jgi:probable HAF family extracellular repeat protein
MRHVLLALAVAALATSAGAQTYTVTNFGPFGTGTLSAATDVNASGVVAGYATPTPTAPTRVGRYEAGTLTNLGLPAATRATWGWGINDAGHVAGSGILSTGYGIAFVHRDGVFTTLPTLGGSSGGARDINNAGFVTGQSTLADNTGRAFRYDLNTGTMTDLGTLGGLTSYGAAINANGWVAGSSDVSMTGSATRAFIARPDQAMFGFGLGGDFSSAQDINDAGKVVGQSSLLDNNAVRHAFLFTGEAVVDLGTLGGHTATAYGINDADVIVGASLKADNNTFYAFIYQNGVMADLNTLIAPGSGWVLNSADAINNAGVIVGMGTFAGEQRGFILTPTAIPEPSTYGMLAGLATLTLAAFRRRHARS